VAAPIPDAPPVTLNTRELSERLKGKAAAMIEIAVLWECAKDGNWIYDDDRNWVIYK
jgi:hypothetical protein